MEEVIPEKNWKPNVLCLGAGGTKGIAELGAMYYFYMNGYLDSITTYIGCSIGGILCLLDLIGYTPIDILKYSLTTILFKNFNEIKWTQVIHECGLISNSSFDDELGVKLKDLITAKIGNVPTLLQLYKKTGKRIIFAVTSMKEEEAFYIDHNTHPDMNLLTALRATANSPGIFGKLEYQKDLFSDGALDDPFPINYLDDGQNQILGVAVRDIHGKDMDEVKFLSYYLRLTTIPLKKITRLQINMASKNCKVIWLAVNDVTMLDDGKNYKKRLKMFEKGYLDTQHYFEVIDPKVNSKVNKINKELPVTKDKIKACLESHAVKTLLKTMKDNPSLVEECAKELNISLNFNTHPAKQGSKDINERKDTNERKDINKTKESNKDHVSANSKNSHELNTKEHSMEDSFSKDKTELDYDNNFNSNNSNNRKEMLDVKDGVDKSIIKVDGNVDDDDDDIITIPRFPENNFSNVRGLNYEDFMRGNAGGFFDNFMSQFNENMMGNMMGNNGQSWPRPNNGGMIHLNLSVDANLVRNFVRDAVETYKEIMQHAGPFIELLNNRLGNPRNLRYQSDK